MGIAVILGHLMHSNGGPFTTSFYLNGPKSRGRKQLNSKLQIRFFSLGHQFFTRPTFFLLHNLNQSMLMVMSSFYKAGDVQFL